VLDGGWWEAARSQKVGPNGRVGGLVPVLSIGKLVAGQARYYLDQAEGRVDAVDSVGEGAEEYYIGGTDARGTWMGVGSASLDLVG
jgi:hypothetical protein